LYYISTIATDKIAITYIVLYFFKLMAVMKTTILSAIIRVVS